MTNILDQIANTHRKDFRPSSPDDYFALRLAHRLGEPEAAAHYSILASNYSQEQLLSAFRKTVDMEERGKHAGQVFHDHLITNRHNGHSSVSQTGLISIHVERRTIAVAVFIGTHLEGRRVLQVSSNSAKAESSVAGFIRSMLSETTCEFAAIEPAPNEEDILRSMLHRTVITQLRASQISVWEVSKRTLFSAFGYPALRSRREIRERMLAFWPIPTLNRAQLCALDAFALGLFVQTERLFNNF